jgi:hypothetical protein
MRKNKMSKICILFLVISIILSCSKRELNYTIEDQNGIKIFKNSRIPFNKNLHIVLRKLFTIKGCDDSIVCDTLSTIPDFQAVSVDSEGNIYILSMQNAYVYKFSSNGKFIKRFGGMGAGPGELKWPQDMYIQNDTVNVLNQTTFQMNKYDANGNFLLSRPTKECKMPVNTKTIRRNRLITYLCDSRYEENGIFMDFDLGLTSSEYKVIKRLKKQTYPLEILQTEYIDRYFGFASNDKDIFVSDNSVDEYRIDVFDCDVGNLRYSIRKPFRKIKAEKEILELSKGKIQFKKPVIELLTDNKGYLWAIISEDRNEKNKDDFLVDIFKDGIFQNRVKIDISFAPEIWWLNGRIFIKDNKLYVSDVYNLEICVFDYNVIEI